MFQYNIYELLRFFFYNRLSDYIRGYDIRDIISKEALVDTQT